MFIGLAVLVVFLVGVLALLASLWSSWRKLPQPRPRLELSTVPLTVLVLLAIPVSAAGDLGPALFFRQHQPDEGIGILIAAPIQIVIAAGLLARVRWGLYAACIVAALAAAFSLVPVPFNLPVAMQTLPAGQPGPWWSLALGVATAVVTGLVDLVAFLFAARVLWRTRASRAGGTRLAT
jgi:hypothetical protein